MMGFLQDFRLSLRLLLKDPLTTFVLVAVLGISIGANTLVFDIVYSKLLRALPFDDPDELVQIWEVSAAMDHQPSTLSPFDFVAWKRASRTFDSMSVYTSANFVLASEDGPQRVWGARVTSDFYEVMGVAPLLGRAPTAEEDRPGSDVVLLSHGTWQQRYGADPGVVGRKLVLDGRPHTILGVMPEEFRFPWSWVEMWTTPGFELRNLDPSVHYMFGVGRLADDVTVEQAGEEMSSISQRLQVGGSGSDSGVLLVPLREEVVGDQRGELLILWAGVSLVLLIACANVGSLLTARIMARQTEMSMRYALGGSRWRVIRQLLTESVVLACLGGAVGLTLAGWGARLLASGYGPVSLRLQAADLDPWVLVFTLGLTLLTAVLLGTAPALWSTRGEIYSGLRQARVAPSRSDFRRMLPKTLVALQVALAVVVLVSAGLLAKSLFLLNRVDVGFDPAGVLTLQFSVPQESFATPGERANVYRSLVDRIQAVPGVEVASGVNDLPLSGSRTQRSVEIPGRSSVPGEGLPSVDYRTVTGDYFRVLGLEVRGETFAERYPAESAPVVVVNQAFVDRFLAAGDALGATFRLGGRDVRIIGVVENLRHGGRTDVPLPEAYVPMEQGEPPEWLYLALLTDLPADTLRVPLSRAAQEVVPDYPLYNLRTLEDRLAGSTATQRFNSLLFNLFGGIALILVLLGIYGLISFAVRERRRDIALRIALGSRRSSVIRLMVRQGLLPVVVGLVGGLLLTVPLIGLLRSMLFGIEPADPYVLVLVPVVLATLAALAALLPARRAAAADPASLLRS